MRERYSGRTAGDMGVDVPKLLTKATQTVVSQFYLPLVIWAHPLR